MANHASSKKRNRQTIKRTENNRARESRVKSFLRKVEEAIATGNKASANEAFKVAQPEFMKGVSKGVFKKETVSRKLSRLSQRIKKLAA